jgi:hypothetical protein
MKPGTFDGFDRTRLTMMILFSSPVQQMKQRPHCHRQIDLNRANQL